MAKPFKLRISRVITSLQSCNSKDTSTLPEDPVPSFLRQSSSPNNSTKLITAVDFPVTAPSNTHRSSSALRRHVSSALISVGCGLTSRNSGDDNDEVLALPPPPPPPSTAERKKRRGRKKKSAAAAAALRRISTSSADESGLFSNDEGETETLVSSLSTDSSFEFNPKTDHNNRIIRRRSKRRPKKRAAKRGTTPTTRRPSVSSSEGEVPARLSVFKKLIPCSVDGKVKESFAVVKKSRDPHEDFKRSMMEMITEKQMFEKDDLEQLLQCFLSLNARQYHGIIVGAFSEIWAELFFAANNVSSSPRMSAFGRRSTPSCS
ncbi:PREDICTED: transcription repressor OFP7-like isoform X3 [Ipomoea nil]|uniref:transcription repressor OFP7-like isoform X2 n=1 Tax=Ipomoea nil TaxID=35883 RepID=UPI000901A483|nr:PREDICTED: transcription repressor OFP7-like isoform X2 [Ipomoea nil]XP_019172974.1 PREDICTED: transcription repressor OFP7-like isoform X3 [Ipomoea nil]